MAVISKSNQESFLPSIKSSWKRAILVTLIFAGFFTAGFWYYNKTNTEQSNTLNNLWSTYKKRYIEEGTNRTINRQEKDITTSEGQSYTQLRAAWMNDKETFDQSWNWTKKNLGRPSDGLFSWLYGVDESGKLGILSASGGQNTATDADIDIAYSLILANRKWKDPSYLQEAIKIINGIWDLEVVQSPLTNKLIIVGNNVEKQLGKSVVVVNPSYFNPVAMREFAKVDAAHDWNKLINDSYELLNKVTIENIDKNNEVALLKRFGRKTIANPYELVMA